jgi:hypothetical protein
VNAFRTDLLLAGLILLNAHHMTGAPLALRVSWPNANAPEEGMPVSVHLDLSVLSSAAERSGPLQLRALNDTKPEVLTPAQFEADQPGSTSGTLRWLTPARRDLEEWMLEPCGTRPGSSLRVQTDKATGHLDVSESGRAVLRYNYGTNTPGELLQRIRPENQKYARPRGDYLHPLYGLDGEELTKDWPIDHPHHRGIYWAWPEVDYHGERGDLHALQRVFARPTGRCATIEGPVFAGIEAENLWLWEDREPIVRETAMVRVWRAGAEARCIDLEFRFAALKEGVSIARRETRLYGGLNVRLNTVQDQRIDLQTDPPGQLPRRAWAALSGTFPGAAHLSGLFILQHPDNPGYPGDWIQYPEINWFQPTFPSAGERYALWPGQSLTLRYRLWLHRGRADPNRLAAAWSGYAQPPQVTQKP